MMKGIKSDIFTAHCCYSKLCAALHSEIYNQTANTAQIFVREGVQFSVSSDLQRQKR